MPNFRPIKFREEQRGRYTRKLSYYNPPKSLLKSSYQKKYLPKFSYPKKSWNLKFQTQKNPSIISVTWNNEYPPWVGL